MAKKYTNLGLVEFVKSKLEVPTIYMLGGFGRRLTQSHIDHRINNLKCVHTTNNRKRIQQGIGSYAYDCVGIIKGYLWEDSPGRVRYNEPKGSDQNTNMMYADNAGRGLIRTMPELPGLIVYMKGHVGVYIGNGEVVEATPAFGAWGVTKTKLKDRPWTHWIKYKFIEYIEPVVEKPIVQEKLYKIKPGDTLTKISKNFGIDLKTLAEYNGIKNKDKIIAGHFLKIPVTSEVKPIMKGTQVRVKKDAVYYARPSKVKIPGFIKNRTHTVGSTPVNNMALITFGLVPIGWVFIKDLEVVQ